MPWKIKARHQILGNYGFAICSFSLMFSQRRADEASFETGNRSPRIIKGFEATDLRDFFSHGGIMKMRSSEIRHFGKRQAFTGVAWFTSSPLSMRCRPDQRLLLCIRLC